MKLVNGIKLLLAAFIFSQLALPNISFANNTNQTNAVVVNYVFDEVKKNNN